VFRHRLCAVLPVSARAEQPAAEAEFYPIVSLATPSDTLLEVGAIELLPGGKIAVATRRGEIRIGSGAYDQATPQWTLFARYLHEVLGLSWRDGSLFATQRPEVTRLKDEDGDGQADLLQCVSDCWGIKEITMSMLSAHGTTRTATFWVTLRLTGSFTAESLYRGWVLRISPDGKVIPTACGVRSPGGIGFGPKGGGHHTGEIRGPGTGVRPSSTSGLAHSKATPMETSSSRSRMARSGRLRPIQR